MKILYIGPETIRRKLLDVSNESFPMLETESLEYKSFIEVPQMLQDYRGKADVFLFSGKTPFKYYEKFDKGQAICDYLPRHENTLYRVLLEITYLLKLSIKSLSVDTYGKKMMQKLYKEIGVSFEDELFYFAEQRYFEETYCDFLTDFHRRNYYENHVCCCITGLEETYFKLKSENIPVVLAIPGEEVMYQAIRNIQLRYQAQKNSENQIVVVAVKLNMPSEYSLMKDDEYAYQSHRIKILDVLYRFNSRIEGVLVEQGRSEFMIFTTKKIMERETKSYTNFYLLDMFREVSVINAYAGIGHGKTANEAKFHAYESIKMAQRHGSEAAYVVFEDGEAMGPLESISTVKKGDSFDERFYQIARATGLSANTIYKVFSNIITIGKSEYTSKELAAICGVSTRTMDRIVLRLCDAGYCDVISEKLMSKHGRPSRILRFKSFLM